MVVVVVDDMQEFIILLKYEHTSMLKLVFRYYWRWLALFKKKMKVLWKNNLYGKLYSAIVVDGMQEFESLLEYEPMFWSLIKVIKGTQASESLVD